MKDYGFKAKLYFYKRSSYKLYYLYNSPGKLILF